MIAKLIVNNGDTLGDVIRAAIRIAKMKEVDYAVFVFNEVKLFAKKDSTLKSLREEYSRKV